MSDKKNINSLLETIKTMDTKGASKGFFKKIYEKLNDQTLDDMKRYGNKKAEVQDAFISKDGNVTKISDQDNILVKKNMSQPSINPVELKGIVEELKNIKEEIRSMKNASQEMTLKDISGNYIGRGIVKNARGS